MSELSVDGHNHDQRVSVLKLYWHPKADVERRTKAVAEWLRADGIPYGLEVVEVEIEPKGTENVSS